MTIEIALQRIAEAAKDKSEMLDLGSLGLTEIPSEVFALRGQLFVLDISNNQIKELPLEITSLGHLEELYLGENPIKEIRIEIMQQLSGLQFCF